MFRKPDTFARISLFPERPATSKSFVAPSTCVAPINIERAYQQVQHLRTLVAQAEHSHNARRMVNRTRDKRHSS
jgi:hypothetical protein